MEDNRHVTEDRFRGRTALCDERFARDKERIEEQEKAMQQVRELTVQMGEILKKYDEKIDAHEKRLCDLERQPADQYGKIKTAIVSAIVSGVVGTIIGSILAAPKP